MRFSQAVVATGFIAMAFAGSTQAAKPPLAEKINRLAKPYVDSETVVGMTVAAVKGDEVVVRGYGRFSADDSRVPDGQTVYEIGSVSKVFTGLLLADAVVQGRVTLHTPVQALLPKGVKMNQRGDQPPALWHLATHTSGLPRLPTNLSVTSNNPYADYGGKEMAVFLNKYQPRKRPCEVMEYSNVGAGLLGMLLARDQKMSYEALLKERIAAPLALDDTGIEVDASRSDRLAPPHGADGSLGQAWDFDALAGCGAVRSTADDLLKFARAHLDPPRGSLGEAIGLAWCVHQTPIKESDFAMGLGWHVARDKSTRWHNGQTGGYHAAIFVSRPLDAAVVVLTNTATMEVDALAAQVIQMLAGADPQPRKFGPPADGVQVSSEVLDRYVGTYQLAPNFVFKVSNKKGQLMVGVTNQPTFAVYPESDTVFRYKVVDASLTFEVDASGACNALTLFQNGARQTAKRVE